MSEAKCPVAHGANSNMEKSSTDWWPKNLNLDILHQHDQKTNRLMVLIITEKK